MTVLPNRWHFFGLRETPFFQDTLGLDPRYPLDLFVGRTAETTQLLTTVGSAASSRQAIAGAAGVGKTTLIQLVKSRAIDAGYWAADELVPFYQEDSPDRFIGRMLVSLYDTILAQRPMVHDHEAMRRAQQLVKVSRAQTSRSGGVGILGVSMSGSSGHSLVTPSEALLFEGPAIFRDLLALVLNEAPGVILHLNNLESLSPAALDEAGDLLRSVRDPLLLRPGLHVLLVGTPEAVTIATQHHAQVRSVFSTPLTLAPLTSDEVVELLRARYEHLALPGVTPTPVLADAVVAELYPTFRGDLRTFLKAMDEGVLLVGGATTSAGPIGVADLRPALHDRYRAKLVDDLTDARAAQLLAWGDAATSTPDTTHTQKSLEALWGVRQASVSDALGDLQEHGYISALPRQGRDATRYVLTGIGRLLFD